MGHIFAHSTDALAREDMVLHGQRKGPPQECPTVNLLGVWTSTLFFAAVFAVVSRYTSSFPIHSDMFHVVEVTPLTFWFYSRRLQPLEKVFLSTHMKCNAHKETVKANFIPQVIATLEGHSARELRACCRIAGWN